MARIYKESRYVLQLLIGKSYGAQYEDVKISFYTKNPNNQVMADDDITIKGNVAEVMVDSTLFDNLEEGLIKYIVYGTKDGIPFIEERQSNYFLKTPLDFKPTTCILEDKSVTPSMGDRDGNNLIVVEESEGYDGLSRVVIDPQTIYNEGVAAGRAEGGSCNLINPIVFSEDAGNTINAENVQIPTFVYEGNQYYNVGSFNLADIGEFKIHILFKPNNSGDTEPINVFGCENTDWDNTTFGARIYQGQIIFKMSGQEVVSPYTENAWYDVEMGYNTTKRWVIVNGETLLDAEYASFNRPSQTLMIGAINSGGNALRPFYGKIAAIYIESDGNQVWLLPKEDGAMYVYWNNRINGRNPISGDNNARFENDYISGDGMKSITWLGNLEDKWVTPSMSERDGNGYIVVYPSEGYNGLKRTVINPQTIYNEGVEAGRAEGGEGSGCTLISRTFTSNGVYHPEALQMPVIWFTADKPSAYDTGIKLVNDSWVEIYFRATEGGDTPTLIGCEEGDWNNTVFATRWYDNNLGVKIGLNEIGIPYTAGDGKLHKLKFGKTVGVWFDDVKVSDIAGEEWAPTDRTIYIGAMNDTSNNNEKGFWRPWVGFIGDVTIYGNLNGNVAEYHFKAGDYGRWGEFKRVEDNTNLRNLGGDGMAITQTGSYGEAPDGFSEVTVNVPQYNLGTLDWTLTEPNGQQKNASDDGYDGYSAVVVRPENIIAQEKENAINDFKNKMDEITITGNGTYSIDDTELTHSISFDGNSYFDTGIVPTENIKIEVCIKVTNGNDSQMGGIIIGGGIDHVNNGTENRGIAIGMGRGAIYGKWGAIKSWNKPYDYVKTTTVVLQKTDDSWRWDTEKGSFGASTLYIGGYNRNGEEVEEKFTQSIVYIKIWTDRNDDSTMTLFRPKNMAQGGFGMVNSEGTEYRYVENLGEGTTTFVEENVNTYPYGFKRVEVNVPTYNVPEYPYSHIPTNTIYYKTADGQLSENIGLDSNGRPSGFGLGINGEVLNIVSNTYEDGVGKIVFDGEVYKVGPVMYSNITETGDKVIKLENIVEIQLPSSITRVENGAFSQTGLREIILPPNITQIDAYALKDMQYLYRIVFYSDKPEILQNNEITLNQTTFGKILHNKAYDYSNMESNTYYKQKGWTFETL